MFFFLYCFFFFFSALFTKTGYHKFSEFYNIHRSKLLKMDPGPSCLELLSPFLHQFFPFSLPDPLGICCAGRWDSWFSFIYSTHAYLCSYVLSVCELTCFLHCVLMNVLPVESEHKYLAHIYGKIEMTAI